VVPTRKKIKNRSFNAMTPRFVSPSSLFKIYYITFAYI